MSGKNNMLNKEQLVSWDKENFFHPSTHLGAHARDESPTRIITGGEGVFITDIEGQKRLDGFAGLYCVNVGYGRQEVAEAIAEQARTLSYYHSYVGHASETSIKLAHMIMERAPDHMSHVYFGLSGSDANETNVKLVWYANNILGRPEKKKIISRWRGYHGSGIITGSLTGLELFHKAFDLPRSPIIHTDAPYYFWRDDSNQDEEQYSTHCAEQLEQLILSEGPDTVAAFIGEPALGTGGLVPPPAGYWQKVQTVLKKYNVMLIADEVVTGFGRLGSMFGSFHYEIKPDIITIAKGLTSAYAPLSGSIVSEKLWKILQQGCDEMGPIGHGWTYSAHPLCAAAGVANLELIDKLDLVTNARETGAYFQDALHNTFDDNPIVGEVRGEGLLAALEFVADKDDRVRFDSKMNVGPRIATAAFDRGLIARAMPQGDILGFAPPLCISQNEIDQVIDITKQAVDVVAAELQEYKEPSKSSK